MNLMKNVLAATALLCGFYQAAFAQTDEATIKHGEYLARAGDCIACHSVSGKAPFSGGLAIESNIGTIYSTNITPDKEHGIGKYTEAQFSDAVRKGILPDGKNLYPAMPYPNYAKISDEDMHALYTYFMQGVKPSAETPPETDLSFPFSMRWGMKLWNMVFTSSDPFKPISGANDQINRGAYLAESLGHCSACHTPRGFAMQEKASDSSEDKFLAGGDLNGWPAPSLRGIPRWTQQDIVDYLATGRNRTAAVGGEMKSVIENSTSYMTDEDLQAIAAYLKYLGGNKTTTPDSAAQSKADKTTAKLTAAKDLTVGERLYLDNCAACHFVDGKGAEFAFPHLDGASIINAKEPGGIIHTILEGATTPSTPKAPSMLPMPGFAYRLDDKEVAQLATFLRKSWTNNAPAVTEKEVKEVRDSIKH